MRIIKAHEIPASFGSWIDAEDSASVRRIVEDVKRDGDSAVRRYSELFDGVAPESFKVSEQEIDAAFKEVPEETINALKLAAANIRRFSDHQRAMYKDSEIETTPGVYAGQRIVPVGCACVYAPGGRYPLPSSVLMGVIPAKVAGVRRIMLMSPPSYKGSVHPMTLVASRIAGADEVYRVGGVQAVAAAAFGTATIPAADVIVGPGNRFVTEAKKLVMGAVGIDFIAGPSEVLVIADDSADAWLIAADLMAQAEHDPDASAILVTTSRALAEAVSHEVDTLIAPLNVDAPARGSIERNGLIIVADTMAKAADLANIRAPEHLELMTEDNESLIPLLKNYGTLFIGEFAAEVIGDYAAGPNHTLPTNRSARYTGGLSVKNFLKVQTTLRVTPSGLNAIGPATATLARAEGLMMHALSVERRLANAGMRKN